MPTFIPNFFASTEAAITHPLRCKYEHTPTGLPRNNGFACCSTDAKKELRSRWAMMGGLVGDAIDIDLIQGLIPTTFLLTPTETPVADTRADRTHQCQSQKNSESVLVLPVPCA